MASREWGAPLQFYNVQCLSDPATQQQYALEIERQLAALSPERRADWPTFRDAMNDSASARLGVRRHSCKEWISERSWELIDRKQEARLAGRRDCCVALRRECKKSLRQDRQHRADEKALAGETA